MHITLLSEENYAARKKFCDFNKFWLWLSSRMRIAPKCFLRSSSFVVIATLHWSKSWSISSIVVGTRGSILLLGGMWIATRSRWTTIVSRRALYLQPALFLYKSCIINMLLGDSLGTTLEPLRHSSATVFFNLAITWGLLRTTWGQPWENLGTTCRLLEENVEAAFEQHWGHLLTTCYNFVTAL